MNTPRMPELPPEASTTYSPNNASGSSPTGEERRPRAGESAVGREIVEVLHHLALGHHREPVEVGELERIDVADELGESAGVEWRAGDGAAKQIAQRGGLVGDDLVG